MSLFSLSGGAAGSGGSGTIGGSTGATDNRLLRSDGVGGSTIQAGQIGEDDTGNVTFPARILGKRGADVPSAADPALGSGNFFVVTGTTTMHSINDAGWTQGSTIILKFSDNVTVTHDSGSAVFAPFALSGAANFSATAGDTLTLILDDTSYWLETSRSVI